MNTLVSIIMPTYNRAKFISRAINSVIEQSYNNWELIIIDDNLPESTARIDTEKVVSSYSDFRIKYIKNEKNLGGALTRNVGIFASRGDYITFLDDDDMYLPLKLEVQLSEMMNNDWDFCVMDGATYNQKDELISTRKQKLRNNMTKEQLIKINLIYHISGTNTFMYKADFLKSIGGWEDIPSCQEYMLVQKTLDANPVVGYINKILIKNYMHDGEQLSTGIRKLDGQEIMFENKKKYFYLLDKKERSGVICRHHGVLFFVHYKMHNYGAAIKEAIKCFFTSPTYAFSWFMEYRKKITV